MKKRLIKRLCAIIMAAVFIMVMTLSFVSPLYGMPVIGACMALMAALTTYRPALTKGRRARAGPHLAPRSDIITGTVLAADLGMAPSAWPDPDQLTYLKCSPGGRMNGNQRQRLRSIRTRAHFVCGQSENGTYNARDQSVQALHYDTGNLIAQPQREAGSSRAMINRTIWPTACAA